MLKILQILFKIQCVNFQTWNKNVITNFIHYIIEELT